MQYQKKDQMFKMLENQLKSKDQLQSKIMLKTQDKLDDLQREIIYREAEIS